MLASGQITKALAARITGLPLAAANVFTDRAWPLTETNLPAWKVVEADEDVEPMTVHGPTVEQHALQVELHGIVRAVSALDDSMRALAAEALTAIFSTTPPADALAAIAGKLQITLRRIQRAMSTEGEAAVGQILITLRVMFRVKANAPETLF